ncbi:MAG: hypothetical protein ACD_10C00051G0003 [uncultured bacterium]|nr:MAG: hypothetical protein ACD_10C00051G0003 [uncultured bacterium]
MGHAFECRLIDRQFFQQAIKSLREVADFIVANHRNRLQRDFTLRHPLGQIGGLKERAEEVSEAKTNDQADAQRSISAVFNDSQLRSFDRCKSFCRWHPGNYQPAGAGDFSNGR